MINKVKRYIPRQVYEKIKDLEGREYMYMICHSIYGRASMYKDIDENSFIEISNSYFTKLIPYKKFYSALQYLKDNGIVICDNFSSKKSGKSLGYKISNEYVSLPIDVEIENITLKKNIVKARNESVNESTRFIKEAKKYFKSTFKIQYALAIEYINTFFLESFNKIKGTNYNSMEEIPSVYLIKSEIKEITELINKYTVYWFQINSIHDGDLYFTRNKTNNRIDTNLTGLKSEFRKFIYGSDKKIHIDIKNSQPFILGLTLRGDTTLNQEELIRYIELTSSGMFYERMVDECRLATGKNCTRKEIKEMMFCILYSKNDSYRNKKMIMQKLFPSINKHINDRKKNDHTLLSIDMQKLEASISIDNICKKLYDLGISYYTIHDSWVIDEKYYDLVVNTVLDSFRTKFGIVPTLDSKYLNGKGFRTQEKDLFGHE